MPVFLLSDEERKTCKAVVKVSSCHLLGIESGLRCLQISLGSAVVTVGIPCFTYFSGFLSTMCCMDYVLCLNRKILVTS